MLQMKLCGDLVLRTVCAPVSDIAPELLRTMDEMVKMMREQNGVGLAAPPGWNLVALFGNDGPRYRSCISYGKSEYCVVQ